VFNAQSQQWKPLRQETARAFTMKAMKRLLPAIQAPVEAVIGTILCSEEVDIQPYLLVIARRLMAHIALGDDSPLPAILPESSIPVPKPFWGRVWAHRWQGTGVGGRERSLCKGSSDAT